MNRIFMVQLKEMHFENVTVDTNGKIDFKDGSVTQNTRVSYPIYHINNIVKPISKAGHATKVIFLTADAFGVMPPVSKLTPEQTKYYFLSGFTAKLAGTERGVTQPEPTFSACLAKPFCLYTLQNMVKNWLRRWKHTMPLFIWSIQVGTGQVNVFQLKIHAL